MLRVLAHWPALIVLAVLCVAIVTDLRTQRIRNWLVFPFFVAGVGVSCWLHGWHGLLQSLEGAGLGLLMFGVLFFMNTMGAGDVKLCAAIGAWIGPMQLFYALVFMGLAGGVMAVAWAAWGGFLGELFEHTGDLFFGSKQERGEAVLSNPKRRRMPYAPAIAIGTLLSYFVH